MFKKHLAGLLIMLLILSATPAVTHASISSNTLAALEETLTRLQNFLATSPLGAVLGIEASVPSLQSLEGVSNPSLAYGLSGVVDYSTSMPFIDVAKIMRPWIGHLPGKWGGVSYEDMKAQGLLDEAGWLKKMPSNVTSVTGVFAWGDRYGSDRSRAGRYVMTYEGEGDIKVDLIPGNRIISTAPGKIVFDIEANEGNWVISIKSTDPNNTGNYLRNIQIVREDHLPLHQAGALFNPDYIAHIKDARVIRFMDMMKTNNSTKRRWSEQPVEADDIYTYAADMPIAVMVRLANEIGADPWFNMPFLADDEYVRKFAQYVRDNLDPDLVAHVELSNEVWNWSFTQARQSHDAGIAAWGLTQATGGASWVNYLGKRSYEVMKIWTEVYGRSADDRLKRVAPTQTVNPWVSQQVLEAPMWKQYDPANYVPPHTMFDVLSPTTYFGGDLVKNETKRSALLTLMEETGSNGNAFHRDLLLKPLPVAGTMSVAETRGGAVVVKGTNTQFVAEVPKGGVLMINGEPYRVSSVVNDTELRLSDRYPGASVSNAPVTVYAGDSIVSIIDRLADQKKLADQYGLQLIPYEGGQHIHHSFSVNIPEAELQALQDHLAGFIRSQEMVELYQALWDGWKALDTGPFMQFVDVGGVSKYGSWGLRASLFDENPRSRLIDRLHRTTPAWWGETGGAHYQQGRYIIAGNSEITLAGTVAEDYIVGSSADNIIYPGAGNDGVNGGAGTDTVILSGKESDYTFTPEGDGQRVVGPDGSDYFYSVEAFIYTDATPVITPVEDEVVEEEPEAEEETGSVTDTVVPDAEVVRGESTYQVTPAVAGEGMNVHAINRFSTTGKALQSTANVPVYTVHHAKQQAQFGTERVRVNYWTINDNRADKDGRELSGDPVATARMFGDLVVGPVTVVGTAFRDDMRGRDQNDVFHGGAGNDLISGDAGDDTLRGGADNDTIDGGKGRDTIEFSGTQAEYTLTPDGGWFKIVGPDGSDRVKNVELVRFLGNNQLVWFKDWNTTRDSSAETQTQPVATPVTLEDLADKPYQVVKDVSSYQAEPEFGEGVKIFSINRFSKTGKELGITASKPAYHVYSNNKQVSYVGEVLRPDYWNTNDNQRSKTNTTPISSSAVTTALLFGDIVFGPALMKGTPYEDDLRGREHNDSFDAGGGNDLVGGGAGEDTLYLSGTKDQYEVLAVEDWFSHLVTGPDGRDRISGIEYLHFKGNNERVAIADMVSRSSSSVLGAMLVDGVEQVMEFIDRGQFVE